MITRALALGATLEREPKDEFYGERSRYTTLLQPGS
jgi:hypothetical protein